MGRTLVQTFAPSSTHNIMVIIFENLVISTRFFVGKEARASSDEAFYKILTQMSFQNFFRIFNSFDYLFRRLSRIFSSNKSYIISFVEHVEHIEWSWIV